MFKINSRKILSSKSEKFQNIEAWQKVMYFKKRIVQAGLCLKINNCIFFSLMHDSPGCLFSDGCHSMHFKQLRNYSVEY